MNLADRIEAHLEDIAPLTAEEIAADLRVRPVAVRRALRGDNLRFVAVRLPNRSHKAVGWMLTPLRQRPRDDSGRPYFRVHDGRAVVAGRGGWTENWSRVVMRNLIGRELEQTEHVHHVNGDPTDDREENLRLMSHSDHGRLHGERQGKPLLDEPESRDDRGEKTADRRASIDEASRLSGSSSSRPIYSPWAIPNDPRIVDNGGAA